MSSQRRFKAIVEKNGFHLEDSKRVIPKEPRPKPIVTLPNERKKSTVQVKTASGQAHKKRKGNKDIPTGVGGMLCLHVFCSKRRY